MKYEPYTLEDVRKAESQKLFTVISTFAGGGGSSLGYRLAGGHVILANEFVEEARNTYLANFPETKILPNDIKELSGEDFLKETGLVRGELDILDGSPPCSAFSTAGRRDKNWKGGYQVELVTEEIGGIVIETEKVVNSDGVKSYSDGKVVEGIEDLFLEFIRVAKDIQPKVIIAENVKGITLGPAKVKLNQFMKAFEEIGYAVTYKVMNAADYGVGQNRERTIFVCIRNDVLDTIGMNIMSIQSVFPNPTTPVPVTLKEALEGVHIDPEEEKLLLDYVQKSFQKKWVEMLPFNPPKAISPADRRFEHLNPKKNFFNMLRASPNLPSPTLTQMGQKISASGVFHPEKNRKFTTDELKRLMSFPDDYILTGTFNQKVERLGRAVASKMMKELAYSVYKNVIEPYNERTSK